MSLITNTVLVTDIGIEGFERAFTDIWVYLIRLFASSLPHEKMKRALMRSRVVPEGMHCLSHACPISHGPQLRRASDRRWRSCGRRTHATLLNRSRSVESQSRHTSSPLTGNIHSAMHCTRATTAHHWPSKDVNPATLKMG